MSSPRASDDRSRLRQHSADRNGVLDVAQQDSRVGFGAFAGLRTLVVLRGTLPHERSPERPQLTATTRLPHWDDDGDDHQPMPWQHELEAQCQDKSDDQQQHQGIDEGHRAPSLRRPASGRVGHQLGRGHRVAQRAHRSGRASGAEVADLEEVELGAADGHVFEKAGAHSSSLAITTTGARR